jgi:hypothetical protein
MKTTWGNVESLHLLLELMALVTAKVKRDDFKGLMLIPWWPRQNWFRELWGWEWTIEGFIQTPQGTSVSADWTGSRWPWRELLCAVERGLIAFSPEACQRAAELDVWPNLQHLASRGPPRTDRVDLVTWRRVQSSKQKRIRNPG